MPGEAWAPQLSDVARHIPTRTRDMTNPGSDALLGTFTSNTTPTDMVAQGFINDACDGIVAQFGDVPNVLVTNPPLATALRTLAELRTAAAIELAYPNRDADLLLVDRLNAAATAQVTVVQAGMAVADTGVIDVFPEWSMPDAPPYADTSPGSGVDFIVKGVVLPNG